MAQVTQNPQLSARIDAYLGTLTQVWEDLPAELREWNEWDELSRLTYAAEWEWQHASQLQQLTEWAAQGVLTPAQQARYDALLQLVARHRPLLDRLLAG